MSVCWGKHFLNVETLWPIRIDLKKKKITWNHYEIIFRMQLVGTDGQIKGISPLQKDFAIINWPCFTRAGLTHTVYLGVLRFVTYLKGLTHHCFSEERVRWPSLFSCRLRNCCILIYNPILGLLPLYPLTFVKQKSTGHHNLWSQDVFLAVCRRTEMGWRKVFKFAASSTWNKLQKDKKLNEPVLLDGFKTMLNDLAEETSGCRCPVWFIVLQR